MGKPLSQDALGTFYRSFCKAGPSRSKSWRPQGIIKPLKPPKARQNSPLPGNFRESFRKTTDYVRKPLLHENMDYPGLPEPPVFLGFFGEGGENPLLHRKTAYYIGKLSITKENCLSHRKTAYYIGKLPITQENGLLHRKTTY